MILISSCICLCPIYWIQVLSREWRCSWSSADRRCSNYIWVINNLIAYSGAAHIRDLTVLTIDKPYPTCEGEIWVVYCVFKVWSECVFYLSHSCAVLILRYLVIPPASTSVRLSVCGKNGVCSVSSTILIGSISYLHILSSNLRRCVACNARFKIKKFHILANSLNL